jgi:hypothetical protein
MKPIQIQPSSALLGAAVALLALLTAGAWQSEPALRARTEALPLSGRVDVRTDPDPRQVVHVVEGKEYKVPEGKLLVLMALGSTELSESSDLYSVILEVDGVIELETVGGAITLTTQFTMHTVPPGFVVPAGKTVTVRTGQGKGNIARAWAYLEDAAG